MLFPNKLETHIEPSTTFMDLHLPDGDRACYFTGLGNPRSQGCQSNTLTSQMHSLFTSLSEVTDRIHGVPKDKDLCVPRRMGNGPSRQVLLEDLLSVSELTSFSEVQYECLVVNLFPRSDDRHTREDIFVFCSIIESQDSATT